VKSAQEWGIYSPKQICPLAVRKGHFCPSGNQPTVIFVTVVPPVDSPVDWAWNQRATALWPIDWAVDRSWIQRAAALCRSIARSIGAIYREQNSLAVDWVGRRAYQPGLGARLCTSVDRTGRLTSASVDRFGRPADSQSSKLGIKNLVILTSKKSHKIT